MQRTVKQQTRRPRREDDGTTGVVRRGFLNHRFAPLNVPLPYRLSETNLLHLRDTVGSVTGYRPYLQYSTNPLVQKQQLLTLHNALAKSKNIIGHIALKYSTTKKLYTFVQQSDIGDSPIWFHLGPLAERQDIREPLRELLSATFTMMHRHMGFFNVLDSNLSWQLEPIVDEASYFIQDMEKKEQDNKPLTEEEQNMRKQAEEVIALSPMYENANFWFGNKEKDKEDTPLDQALRLINLDHKDIKTVLEAFLHAFDAQDTREQQLKDLCAEALVWGKEGYDISTCLTDTIDYQAEGYEDLESYFAELEESGCNVIYPDMTIGFTYKDNSIESEMENKLTGGYEDFFVCDSLDKELYLYENTIDTNTRKQYDFYEWILRFHHTYSLLIG